MALLPNARYELTDGVQLTFADVLCEYKLCGDVKVAIVVCLLHLCIHHFYLHCHANATDSINCCQQSDNDRESCAETGSEPDLQTDAACEEQDISDSFMLAQATQAYPNPREEEADTYPNQCEEEADAYHAGTIQETEVRCGSCLDLCRPIPVHLKGIYSKTENHFLCF